MYMPGIDSYAWLRKAPTSLRRTKTFLKPARSKHYTCLMASILSIKLTQSYMFMQTMPSVCQCSCLLCSGQEDPPSIAPLATENVLSAESHLEREHASVGDLRVQEAPAATPELEFWTARKASVPTVLWQSPDPRRLQTINYLRELGDSQALKTPLPQGISEVMQRIAEAQEQPGPAENDESAAASEGHRIPTQIASHQAPTPGPDLSKFLPQGAFKSQQLGHVDFFRALEGLSKAPASKGGGSLAKEVGPAEFADVEAELETPAAGASVSASTGVPPSSDVAAEAVEAVDACVPKQPEEAVFSAGDSPQVTTGEAHAVKQDPAAGSASAAAKQDWCSPLHGPASIVGTSQSPVAVPSLRGIPDLAEPESKALLEEEQHVTDSPTGGVGGSANTTSRERMLELLNSSLSDWQGMPRSSGFAFPMYDNSTSSLDSSERTDQTSSSLFSFKPPPPSTAVLRELQTVLQTERQGPAEAGSTLDEAKATKLSGQETGQLRDSAQAVCGSQLQGAEEDEEPAVELSFSSYSKARDILDTGASAASCQGPSADSQANSARTASPTSDSLGSSNSPHIRVSKADIPERLQQTSEAAEASLEDQATISQEPSMHVSAGTGADSLSIPGLLGVFSSSTECSAGLAPTTDSASEKSMWTEDPDSISGVQDLDSLHEADAPDAAAAETADSNVMLSPQPEQIAQSLDPASNLQGCSSDGSSNHCSDDSGVNPNEVRFYLLLVQPWAFHCSPKSMQIQSCNPYTTGSLLNQNLQQANSSMP